MMKLNVKENQLLTTKFMTKYTANDLKRILLIFHSLVPMLNKAGSNKYINTYLIFICALRVRLIQALIEAASPVSISCTIPPLKQPMSKSSLLDLVGSYHTTLYMSHFAYACKMEFPA